MRLATETSGSKGISLGELVLNLTDTGQLRRKLNGRAAVDYGGNRILGLGDCRQ
jgi:hypothetical protein